MSLAMKRLKNIGWLALVFLVLITLYPLSLHVASMHSDLVNVDNKILSTKREISFLQAVPISVKMPTFTVDEATVKLCGSPAS